MVQVPKPLPTVYPVVAFLGKWIEERILVVPEVRLTQFAPPSVVFRMVPFPPAAYPVVASTGKCTE
jgi:hypothetical protein